MAAEAVVTCRGEKKHKRRGMLRNTYKYIHTILFRLLSDANILMYTVKAQRIDKQMPEAMQS